MRRAMSVFLAAAALVVACFSISAADSPREPGRAHIGHARFEGRWIDLAQGWGRARACMVVSGRPTECFRTVAAMEERAASIAPSMSPTLNCSIPLKLRDGANQVPPTVSIYSRGIWVNLSSLSFDNKTSSFTVGACSIDLASSSGGGGSHYLSCLYAGCVEDTMDLGWNNAVSSAYLD
jgi:hypothetical protein